MLTSPDEQADRLQRYRIGADGFVGKPVDFSRLAEAVARVDIYWLATKAPPPAG